MDEAGASDVSDLVIRARSGDREAFDRLFPIIYDDLRRLARAQRRRWEGDESLNTTALVHECYLRLVGQSAPGWKDRAHFLAVAARAIRHILIDYARARQADKRGGRMQRLTLAQIESALEHAADPSAARDEALMALQESLERLERLDARQSRIVECRFFGGMTIPETAEALGVSPSSVTRGWSAAQAWLYRDLSEALGPAS